MTPSAGNNAAVLAAELQWLQQLIGLRLRLFFNDDPAFGAIGEVPVPPLASGSGAYADFVNGSGLDVPERIVLLLSLAPHIRPEILDGFFAKNTTYDKRFTEFGGVTAQSGSFLPTGETALFLLAGTDLEDRLVHYRIFDPERALMQCKVLKPEPVTKGEPLTAGRLALSDDYAAYLITGSFPKPHFSETFPAKAITTELEWADVVHTPHTLQGITEIRDWIEHGHVLLNGMGLGKRLKPGFKALFYGPPGTGKTMTAALLGKSTGRDVYRVDLSMIVSKYIGETEKNLANVFDQAADKDWILFFDEADALFGKRVEAASANDRFANQEVAYLLQRVEDHAGVVILASNLKDNIDKAFLRRFQSVIYFPMPGMEERYAIWKQSFSAKLPPAEGVDLQEIARKYELSGGLMMNVIRYCSLKAVKAKSDTISLEDIETGIRKELQKDGIILT